ncbi:hypothetical protein GC177_04135 [bacterium]|nr:hypothetical protein [bacterium]
MIKRLLIIFCAFIMLNAALSPVAEAAKHAKQKAVVKTAAPVTPVHAKAMELPPGKPLPRTIVTLYTSTANPDLAETYTHRMAEMPMNHLGLIVKYFDIEHGLPDLNTIDGVRGVFLWFDPASRVPDAEAYLKWIEAAADKGIPIVSFGHSFLFEDRKGNKPTLPRINALLNKLGINVRDRWVTVTYDVKVVHEDRRVFGFERQLPPVIKSYQGVDVTEADSQVYLAVDSKEATDKRSTLVMQNDRFSYVAEGYEVFSELEQTKDEDEVKAFRQWYVNPFEFFRRAYHTDELPKPDTTTQAGRRIFYHHIDGDGWNNLSDVPAYKDRHAYAARVVLEEIIKKYNDLPVTVAAIAADLDPAWVGKRESQEVAREIYAQPNVEPASHTYSHPFYWDFFAKYDPNIERQYFKNYSSGHWADNFASKLFKQVTSIGNDHDDHNVNMQCEIDNKAQSELTDVPGAKSIPGRYYIPRAYANMPFNLDQEMCGAAFYIQQFVPKGKQIGLVQWSGNTRPFEAAIRKARNQGLLNLNGGDTRFDPEFPSYVWVAPIGRLVGGERQIYSSSSNEITYTGDWSGRYYGYKYLYRTVMNTEMPVRVKPFNIYYHMFSGQKLASLNAVKENLNFARRSLIHPVTATNYSRIANGFYTTQIIPDGLDQWLIKERGDLQTIRFDRAGGKTVDYQHSRGVVGHSYLQGSLYIYLDAAVEEPVIKLTKLDLYGEYAYAHLPYLINSRWKVWGIHNSETELVFYAQGFGLGTMRWRLPKNGKATVSSEGGKVLNPLMDNGFFTFSLQAPTNQAVKVTITY